MNLSLLDIHFVTSLLAMIVACRLVARSWIPYVGTITAALLIGVASPETLMLLGGTVLFLLFPLVKLIRYFKSKDEGTRRARWVLILGGGAVVLLWVLFKTHRQISIPFLSQNATAQQLLTALGFSYFLFKAINFLYMHYLIDIPESNPLRVLYYVLFPPTITSGPIQKYTDFCKEIDAARTIDLTLVGTGVYRITKGYFYKVCIAAVLNSWTDQLLAIQSPMVYHSLLILCCLYLFFFFDFAGYSHIAIGFGLLLGIKVPENFKKPFVATSVTEFWRNWHVTLVDWFRDHVFIPFGGMRLGGLRAAGLAGAIMLACGFWHGFTGMFIAWGVWHGSILFLEGILGTGPMPRGDRRGPKYWIRILWTNVRVAFGAIFFLPSFDAILLVLKGFLRWV